MTDESKTVPIAFGVRITRRSTPDGDLYVAEMVPGKHNDSYSTWSVYMNDDDPPAAAVTARTPDEALARLFQSIVPAHAVGLAKLIVAATLLDETT